MAGRVGNIFLHPWWSYGGPRFPRDTRALARIAEERHRSRVAGWPP